MINSLKVDGILRERSSKTLLTGDYSEIEIQCYECGIWKSVKKLTNEMITEKFFCGSCKRKNKAPKKKITKKKTTKAKKWKNQFPENCPHKAFFGCKVANQCQGCYYNPDKKIALMPKYGIPFEPGEKKNTKEHWFYGDKKHSEKALGLLEEIKSGKGLLKGGARSHFKYARKKYDEDE